VYTVVGKDSSCKLKIEKQINGTQVKNKSVDDYNSSSSFSKLTYND
jgi:hypothetical protein